MYEIFYQNGLWYFDHNNSKRYAFNESDNTILEEWYDFDNNYHNRYWTLDEFNYSHSDRDKINKLFERLGR